MELSTPLQMIFGTDKRNPVFTVYSDNKSDELHLYYGAELLEKVPDDREHPQFKMLVGRLYNADVNARILGEVFGASRKTMKRWGAAVTCGDSQVLARVLAGRGGNRKFIETIRRYVRMRFPSIYRETQYEYRSRMLEEIEEVFDVCLSGETIRPLLNELKAIERAKRGENTQTQKEQTACDCDKMEHEMHDDAKVAMANNTRDIVMQPDINDAGPANNNRKGSPTFCEEPSEQVTLCHHAGVLLFFAQLLRIETWVDQDTAKEEPCGWLIKQWLAAILLGAVNIEQTKLLDYGSLQALLGRTLRLTHGQRTELGYMASNEMVQMLLRFNAREVNAAHCSDFYYDPHTKQYTGMHKVLKGWCASLKSIAKVLHMDFVHTADGYPVYIYPTDNYEDLRERFTLVIQKFRAVIEDEQKVLTFVFDRGIYAQKTFQTIIENETCHVITWEKNYKPITWQTSDISGSFALERVRNHAADIKTYTFEYIDTTWEKDQRMRLIHVRATNPKERTVKVGVLCDDTKRDAQQIIRLIFQRWIQENDFKYLDTHFGINEITTYATTAYDELQEHTIDKSMKSGEYKALEMTLKESREKLAKLLLREHEHPRKNKKRTAKIEELTSNIVQTRDQLSTTEKEMSRLEFLIEQNYVRLDARNKHIMDAIKLIARNAFYALLKPFKKLYNNYRDDHVLFRNLTQSAGVLRQTPDIVEVTLLPTPHYPPKTQRIIQRILQDLNATNPQMPDGSGRQLNFHLGTKEDFQFAIVRKEKARF